MRAVNVFILFLSLIVMTSCAEMKISSAARDVGESCLDGPYKGVRVKVVTKDEAGANAKVVAQVATNNAEQPWYEIEANVVCERYGSDWECDSNCEFAISPKEIERIEKRLEVDYIQSENPLKGVTFCSDSDVLAIESYNNVSLFRVKDKAVLHRFEIPPVPGDIGSHEGARMACNLGRGFAAMGDDTGLVRIWDTDSGKLLFQTRVEGSVQQMAESPDGSAIAVTASSNGYSNLRLLSTESGDTIRTFSRMEGYMYDISFSHDGQLVAVNGRKAEGRRTIAFWTVFHVGDGEIVQHIEQDGWQSSSDSIWLSPSNHVLVANYNPDGLELWELGNESPSIILPKRGNLFALSHDGFMIAVGAGEYPGDVTLFNAANGEQLRLLAPNDPINNGIGPARYLSFNGDDSLLAVGDWTNNVLVWRLK